LIIEFGGLEVVWWGRINVYEKA